MALQITSASCTPLAVRMRASGGAPAGTSRLSLLGSEAPTSGLRVASPGGAPAPLSRRRCCTTGNDDGQSPLTYDLQYFLEATKKPKEYCPATSAEASPEEINPTDAAYLACKCLKLIEELLRNKYEPHPLPADTLKEVCRIGKSFVEVLKKYYSPNNELMGEDIGLLIPELIKIARIFPGDEDVLLSEDNLQVKGQPDAVDLLIHLGRTYVLVRSKYRRLQIEE